MLLLLLQRSTCTCTIETATASPAGKLQSNISTNFNLPGSEGCFIRSVTLMDCQTESSVGASDVQNCELMHKKMYCAPHSCCNSL